jgi:pentapeptide repeat protein
MSAYLAESSSSHSLLRAAVIVALVIALAALIIGLINSGVQWKQAKFITSEQIKDRFMQAVGQLASESTQVRMGAIVALEQIADESPRDRPYIVNLLAVHIRHSLPDWQVREGEWVRAPAYRVPDAQAALTALCRKPLSDDRRSAFEAGTLNLARTDLRRANLANADLRRANLRRAHLEGADLRGADLRDADLGYANLDSFMPSNPDFQRGADLRGANLCGAQLADARNLWMALTEDAVADDRTTWPDGFNWEAAGIMRVGCGSFGVRGVRH